ncbi:ATP-binding protein [bacterium]|nr:ATP-binding protein [bacterium]
MKQTHVTVPRPRLENFIRQALTESPITVLLGPRQTGKTTLATKIVSKMKNVHFFDLETTTGRAAMITPELTLKNLTGTIVIDEVQRKPELFEILRPLADRPGQPATFLLLGSASPDLIRGVSESLAGRALFVHITGFRFDEISDMEYEQLWIRGGFPRSFLARSEESSYRWRDAFVTTILERDLPQMGIRIPAETLRRFWLMLAHYHGQTWNGSEIAQSIGVSHNTTRHYLDILAGAYVIRILSPWFENLKKRQVKSPKIYIRDSGILHFLLGIENMSELRSNPKYGASWEGFALEQVIAIMGTQNIFFWRTQRGAELDLLILKGNRRIGIEFKCADAPGMTKSMHIALQDLKLDHLYIVYPGSRQYPLNDKTTVVPITKLIFN